MRKGTNFILTPKKNESRWDAPRFKIRQKKENITVVSNRKEESPWEVIESDDGSVYYYNSITGESSWTMPDSSKMVSTDFSDTIGEIREDLFLDENWEKVESKEDGSIYYYNKVTGESTWNHPRHV